MLNTVGESPLWSNDNPHSVDEIKLDETNSFHYQIYVLNDWVWFQNLF